MSIWIISTLEICVELGSEKAILLGYPSYPLSNQRVVDSHDEGYWAPPFVATPVELGYSPPTTLGSVRALVRKALAQLNVKRDLEQLAYQMGLRDVDLEEREPFLELKVSPRSPDHLKAYYVLRHGLTGVDASSIRSLTDSEGRRGYVFCPTDMPATHCVQRLSATHGRDETWFLGKPLQSNIDWVLRNPDRRSRIEAHTIQAVRDQFVRHETGIMCAVDVAGYGFALQYAENEMHSFGITGPDSQASLRLEVSRLLLQLLIRVGTTQAQIAGDGMIAAFPQRVFPVEKEVLTEILAEWTDIVDELDEYGGHIRDAVHRPGSRMSLLSGNYAHGRLAGLDSFIATFDGQDIVTVARMEQGLAAFNSSGSNVSHGQHLLALSLGIDETIGETVVSLGWRREGVKSLSAKEYCADSVVYTLDRK
jgi:hypothetical protein